MDSDAERDEPVLTQNMPQFSPLRTQRDVRANPGSSSQTSGEGVGEHGLGSVPSHAYATLIDATFATAKDAGDAENL